jgi:hypothetical protein
VDKKKQRLKGKLALEQLCQDHDVGFVTEPGQDIRDTLLSADRSALPAGTWACCGLSDEQSEHAACRPLIYVKRGTLTVQNEKFESGKDGSSRYPACAVWSVDDINLLLIALHATSGYGADKNVQGMLDFVEEKCCGKARRQRSRAWTAWLIGGDMNSVSGAYSPLRVPNDVTQQSGYTLDGFFADCDDQAEDQDLIKINSVAVVPQFTLYTKHNAPLGTDVGCYFQNVNVSDHRPVEATVQVIKGARDKATKRSRDDDDGPKKKKLKT